MNLLINYFEIRIQVYIKRETWSRELAYMLCVLKINLLQ